MALFRYKWSNARANRNAQPKVSTIQREYSEFAKQKKDSSTDRRNGGTSERDDQGPRQPNQNTPAQEELNNTYARQLKEQSERITSLEAQVEGLTTQVQILERELTRAINIIQENANYAQNQMHEISGAVETTRELVGDLTEQMTRATASQTATAIERMPATQPGNNII